MIEAFLFDWGDTLMIDFPDAKGKMCEWEKVEAVAGAKITLLSLSKQSKIYVATGAADSTEQEIKLAFERVGLSKYISGYFCKENIGFTKAEPEFLKSIISMLKISPSNIVMVGDSFEKDIKPALASGITPIWFSSINNAVIKNVYTIKDLTDLINHKINSNI